VTALQECVSYDDAGDKNNVVLAPRKGTLGSRVHSDAKIMSMKHDNKRKWTKYSKYIRRWINPQPIKIDNLQRWFHRYKVTASKGSQPAGGRTDPITGSTLFTEDTKNSVLNAYINAEGVTNTLRRDKLYRGVQPTLNSKTKPTEWIGSRGVESKLERSHQAIVHFANTGMGKELSDALTLAGIALYNLYIRRRLQMSCMPAFKRAKVPAGTRTYLHIPTTAGRITSTIWHLQQELSLTFILHETASRQWRKVLVRISGTTINSK
jgi:hypothetical protein